MDIGPVVRCSLKCHPASFLNLYMSKAKTQVGGVQRADMILSNSICKFLTSSLPSPASLPKFPINEDVDFFNNLECND